jgi:hypothetical protein
MNFQPSTTTTVPQALLIRHGHNYFENGQTRRIKNLTYSRMPVDHNAAVRKTLLRKRAEGYRALTVFAELISIATRCPQRGLVVDAQEGPIIAKRIARTTGMSEPEVRSGLEPIANKELKSISPVACHSATPSSPNPTSVACHTQTLTLTPQHPVARSTERVAIQKVSTAATGISDPDIRVSTEPIANKELNRISPVACHIQTPTLAAQHPVARHTERAVIQGKSTPTTRMTEPAVRSSLEPIASKELKSISPVARHSTTPSSPNPTSVACHTQTPRLARQHRMARPEKLIVSGSLRTSRKGKPLRPELIHPDNPSATAPNRHIECGYPIADKGNHPKKEFRLLKALEKLLSTDKEEVKDVDSVACHSATPPLSIPSTVACHTQTLTLTPQHRMARSTERAAIQGKSTAATGISDPDIRVSTEPIASKELKPISPVARHSTTPSSPNPNAVACHTQTPALAPQHRMAPKKISSPL